MKTRIFSALLFTVSFFFLWGCAPKGWQQSQDEYKKGNIHAAVQWAAATLVEKPNYEDAILFLQKVLPEIYDDYLKQSKVSESKKDWDQAVLIYKNIVWFGEVVAKIPPQINEDTKEKIVFATLDVSEELENATNKAAEAHYNKGLSFENSSKSKEAAKEYSKAIEYVPATKMLKKDTKECVRTRLKEWLLCPLKTSVVKPSSE
ncbi:MAG: hypothetical protein QY308_09750 [Ignavibacteriaceae bacterium]|nr:MAG: hypothetical protein QY308_09750 [Ignavibacteriaceae bacterium]